MSARIEQMLRDNPTVTPAMLLANAKHFAKPLSPEDIAYAEKLIAPAEQTVAAAAHVEQPVFASDSPLMQAALACVARGWYVFALGERAKEPDPQFSPHGFNSSTNDPNVVRHIWSVKPNANYGIDLRRSGLTVLDFDNGVPPAELNLPTTLQVSTSRGVHAYFAGSVKTGKMQFNGVALGDIKSNGGYVLGAQSVHPSGAVYSVIVDAPIAALPSLDALRGVRASESQPVNVEVDGPSILHGSHDDTLRDIARKLRGMGWEHDAILERVKQVCLNRCVGYGSDWEDMCEKHAQTAMKFEPNPPSKPLTLNQSVAPAQPAQPQEWPEPRPAGDKLVPVPAFDPSFIPDAFAPWVTDVAERMSVPTDFPGIAALTIAAGVTGRRAFVYPKRYDKEWKEPLNLSGAVVASSGAVKTPTWKALLAPVIELESGWEHDYKASYAKYSAQHAEWEVSVKKQTKDIKKGKKVAVELNNSEPQETVEPISAEPIAPLEPRRLMLTDATPEKLHAVMEGNPEGILFYRDELTSWAAELDKKGYESARGIHLAATNGNDYFPLDRIERGTVKAIMCESIFGSFQPEIFREFISNSTNLHDGMIPRFTLLVWPDSIERKRIDKPANEVGKELYRRIIQRLAKSKAQNNELHFTPEAQNAYDKWSDDLMIRIGWETNEAKKSYLSKMNGCLPRIAALFQLIDLAAGSGEGPIMGRHFVDEAHLMKAVAFSKYLEAQMHRVYNSIRTAVQVAESALVDRIKAGELSGQFTLRDIHRKRWHGLTRPDDVESALDTLQEKGWVRCMENTQMKTRGRPTVWWEINPKVVVDAF